MRKQIMNQANYVEATSSYDELIIENRPLVIKIVKSIMGGDYDDKIGDGYLGLVLAAKNFNPEKGKFSTFAASYIKGEIIRGIERAKTINRTDYMERKHRKADKIQNRYLKEVGRNASETEIAEELEITIEKVRELEQYNFNFVSLNREIYDEASEGIEARISDEVMPSPEDLYIQKCEHEELMTQLNKLSQKEYTAVTMGFGIGAYDEECSNSEIAEVLSMSKEGARKTKIRGIENLRAYYENSAA